MREGLVGLRHTVGVFALLHRGAAVVGRVQQLGTEAVGHGLLRTAAGGLDDPADRQRLSALRADLDRHLVGRAADAAGAHLEVRLHIVQGIVEGLHRVGLRLLLDLSQGAVDNGLGSRLLAGIHQRVDELGDHQIAKLGIRQNFALLGSVTTGHRDLSLLRPLGAILGTALLAVLDALGIERAADDVIANAGQVLHTAATDHDDGVFLQVVAFAGNVGRDFKAVGETDARNLAQGGVRLLRRRRIDAGADAALLRAGLQGRNLVARLQRRARVSDQLVDRWHSILTFARPGRAHWRLETAMCKMTSPKRRSPTWSAAGLES